MIGAEIVRKNGSPDPDLALQTIQSALQSGLIFLGGGPDGNVLSFTPPFCIEIDEIDGAKTVFIFTNEAPNAAIPESLFHFAPPAGVPVVDALPPV